MLEQNGVSIRNEPLGGGGGGLCTLKDENIFFVDTQTPNVEIAVLCAEAVAKLVNTEKVYIKPEVRQFIENHSGKE